MKISCMVMISTLLGLVASHAIFQKMSVNYVDQGQLKGIRAPAHNNPLQKVNDPDFACNKYIVYDDANVIWVPAGARVGAWWGHVIGGAQIPNDPDHPIARSHKGPIMVYLARVSNAASSPSTGLKWFKIAELGLTDGVWAVDRMITNDGWHYFTMPTCVAPGDYLMRVELLALHSAGHLGEAQFYVECAQIRVTGSGSNAGTDLVSFPGAYSREDPGILINIYNGTKPNNGGRPYPIPGPKPIKC